MAACGVLCNTHANQRTFEGTTIMGLLLDYLILAAGIAALVVTLVTVALTVFGAGT